MKIGAGGGGCAITYCPNQNIENVRKIISEMEQFGWLSYHVTVGVPGVSVISEDQLEVDI